MTTQAAGGAIEGSHRRHSCVAELAGESAIRLVRNMGTIGGLLANAIGRLLSIAVLRWTTIRHKRKIRRATSSGPLRDRVEPARYRLVSFRS